MRIHVQNPPDDPAFTITPALWAAAAAAAGPAGAGHAVSFGTTPADFAAAIAEAEALVGDKDVLRALLPAPAPRLRVVFVANAGLDNLAPFDWLPPGAILLNNRGTHSVKAGEFGLMAVLMLASAIPAMVTDQRAGLWRKRWGRSVAGQRLTVVGLGALGGAVATQAARLGMVVTGVRARPAPHPACVAVVAAAALDAVLPASDVLVLACPLTAATRGLLDRRRIGLLPRHAGLVNIGRGPLLDQDALCDALDAGLLSGAVLDVFDPEPIPPGHRLWTTPNLIISPHTAADDPDTYLPRSLEIFFANLRALAAGKPAPTRFDPARGY
ncbi:MAG: D-2-hydroxyacid dehydrogenase [Rhodospirillales bacterium]|jgi:phosphoglycerate dehydrogenase-like enzyme|nr:D-2-hydroxyacid dehydrogenase [Rhodospirillales bacterium]